MSETTHPPASQGAPTAHPSGVRPTARFDELEAYRGIAAIAIMIFHTYQYSREGSGAATYLFEGTPWHALFSGLHLSGVFFALSGFLLFLPFARAAIRQDGERSARSFLIRRLIRILPLYYLVLLVVWCWRFTGRPDQIADLLLHLSFTQPFHPTYIFWTVGPTWSLAVEMHFYLLLALCAPGIYRLCGMLRSPGRRVAALAAALGALVAAGALFKLGVAALPGGMEANWLLLYSLPAKLDAIAMGMLLALLVAARDGEPWFGMGLARTAQCAGLGLIGLAIGLEGIDRGVELFYSSIVGMGIILLIGSTTLGPRGSGLEHVLKLPPLRFVGTLSYGIYLLHEPLLIELGKAGLLISPQPTAFLWNVGVLLVVSVGGALLAHHLLERPFHQLYHLFDSRGRLVERYAATPTPHPQPPARPVERRAPRPQTATG